MNVRARWSSFPAPNNIAQCFILCGQLVTLARDIHIDFSVHGANCISHYMSILYIYILIYIYIYVGIGMNIDKASSNDYFHYCQHFYIQIT